MITQMIIEAVESGPFFTKGYLVGDETKGDAVIVDAPKDSAHLLTKAASHRNLTIQLIINTHGHWDHIADNAVLQQQTLAPIAIHKLDEPRILDPKPVFFHLPFEISPTKAGKYLEA